MGSLDTVTLRVLLPHLTPSHLQLNSMERKSLASQANFRVRQGPQKRQVGSRLKLHPGAATHALLMAVESCGFSPYDEDAVPDRKPVMDKWSGCKVLTHGVSCAEAGHLSLGGARSWSCSEGTLGAN